MYHRNYKAKGYKGSKIKKEPYMTKNPVGRPTLSPEQRKTHKRIALYPNTYNKVKLVVSQNKVKIVDLIKELVDEAYDENGNRR